RDRREHVSPRDHPGPPRFFLNWTRGHPHLPSFPTRRSHPAKPVFIRDFGLAGQEPGSTGPIPVPQGVHGPIARGNRVYFAYSTSSDGVLQILDRQKLLTGTKEPTAANLALPEISRLPLSPNWGGHTEFPLLGVTIPDYAADTHGKVRDFVRAGSEATQHRCREFRH